jgi:hypothetical protein
MTERDAARRAWEREGWGEPRDAAQEILWVKFWRGDVDPDAPMEPRNWTRPPLWVEELVRS